MPLPGSGRVSGGPDDGAAAVGEPSEAVVVERVVQASLAPRAVAAAARAVLPIRLWTVVEGAQVGGVKGICV